ncbi:MAG TPA: PAS domain S-box protein [Gemmatimonadales bacterium]|nr:PAS domain S-box protein [Gemmatimonadales bacterium]
MTHASGAVRSGRLDDVLERLGDAALAVDAEGRCIFLNPAAARLIRDRYGAVHGSLLGRLLRDHLPGFAGSALDHAIQRARRDLEIVTYEERDPAYARCLETRVFPSEAGVSVLIRDITEMVAARDREVRERRRVEERFRQLVESVEDVVFRLDRDQRCVDIFGRWLEREGYRPRQFLGRTTRQIVGAANASAHEVANLRALAGETVVYEWTLERPDGTRHMQTSLSPLRGPGGRILGIAGVGRDMTRLHEEMRARAYAESEAARWAYIFERAAWGVAIASADGERFEAVNPAFARMMGYDPEELRGRPVRDLYPPRRYAELPVQLKRTERRGHHIWETELLRKDGSVFPALVDVAAITNADGRVGCYASTVRDLTERKRAEEQVRQAQRTDIVGRLAGGVTHDFNNLLMVILGFADLLGSGLDPDDPRRGDVAEIRKAAERASGLARQLLTIGRPTIVHRELLDLNRIVQDLDPLLRPLVPASVRVRIELAAGLGAIAADRGQIEQVVVNLALNARDAMPYGGELLIETQEVTIEPGSVPWADADLPPGAYVVLVVRDTGEGMDDTTRARLFEPFFTTKTSSRNAGLGLSTVCAIVTQAGGHVSVESAPGAGTTFRICLPKVATAPPARPALLPPTPVGGNECVLIVEDEASVRTLAGRALAGLGYTVLEAEHGREALKLLHQYPGTIDLVITDVVMPELGGMELIEALATERPETAVLIMSGYLDSDTASDVIRDADLPFLQKPFGPDDLSGAVRAALDRRSAR